MLLCSNSIASIKIRFLFQIARGTIKYLDTYVRRNLLLDTIVSRYRRSAVNFGDWFYADLKKKTNQTKNPKPMLTSKVNAVELSTLFKLTFRLK